MASEESLLKWQRPSPFGEALRIELVSARDRVAQLRLPFFEAIENRKGNVHGGAIATLADIAMGHSIRAAGGGLYSLSTVNLNINYVAPGTGELMALGRCTKFGRSTCFATVEITDAENRLVASASGVFRIIHASDAQPG